MEQFGLSEKHLQIINGIYSKYPEIQKVLVYGSRALGTYRPGSDIDMTIIGDVSSQALFKIINDFDDSMLPYLVDISIFSKLKNPGLIEHINTFGKVIYPIYQ
ncbi:MAG: nucleotidyltransferase domain-containing protein [Treponema sp.]|nr:nucleotidyltransferase domain-containing protein [Spirochaetia bacterium]MDD7459642.1 nucleotidyltransferase domain-containing protein [Spirochaetales bacterium]MDY5811634.1 nucleotidyltransferase domain-containing protein [Treponema sp.]